MNFIFSAAYAISMCVVPNEVTEKKRESSFLAYSCIPYEM